MVEILLWILGGVGVIVFMAALAWIFHCVCIRLEEAGYLYYRKKKEGGGSMGGAFSVLDELTRPSIQHVVEVQDTNKIKRNDVGGD